MTNTVKTPDPRVFKDNRIDPMEIHGFAAYVKGQTKAIIDHPEYPNPRSAKNMSMGVVEDVKAAGSILEPVKLFWEPGGAVILADGKTRLTGLGEHLKMHPELIGKLTIPLQRLIGTPTEIKLLMLKYGLDDTRSPLVSGDVAKYLRRLDEQGVTQAEQLRILDRGGRQGVMWLNRMKAVITANPAVIEAFEEGRMELTTAKQIGKSVPFSEQKQAVEAFLKAKATNPELPESELRKLTGIKKSNRVTVGYDTAIEFIIEHIYPAYDYSQYLRRVKGKNWVETLDWSDEVERNRYLETVQAEQAWEAYTWFLKLTGMSIEEQRQVIEEAMEESQALLLEAARSSYASRSTEIVATKPAIIGFHAG